MGCSLVTRLLFAALLGSTLLSQEPGQLTPIPIEPEAEAGPAETRPESATECTSPYTTTSCSLENQKFVQQFSVAMVLLAGLGGVVLPLFGSMMPLPWWRWTSHWWRWGMCTLMWIGIILAFGIALPVLAYRGIVDPRIGLLPYWTVKPDFLAACSPCASRVTNYTPLFGWFDWLGRLGMPEMGLALDQPWAFLAAVLLTFTGALLLWLGARWMCLRFWGFERLSKAAGGGT